ncbi:MAG: ferrochelatase [bacterium]|nr:ferrochelatase [bacterium]
MSKGILLLNIGSPDSPSVADVRAYLKQFLMDPYVLDIPYLLRWVLVNLVILRKRPSKSAHAYQEIWWEEGSPLLVIHDRIAKKLAAITGLPVENGMAYGKPSIKSGLESLVTQGVTDITVMPMFPQYAMATTEGLVANAQRLLTGFPGVKATFLHAFYNNPAYQSVLYDSMAPYIEKMDADSHLLLSFHGLPERHLKKSDPTGSHCLKVGNCCQVDSAAHATCYRHQCFVTTADIIKKSGLDTGQYTVAFQSRLGRDEWLKPYTSEKVIDLATQGVKHLYVACPAFVADCLETLEEIGIGIRDDFLAAGGTDFTLIPCLNDDDRFIDVLRRLGCGRE